MEAETAGIIFLSDITLVQRHNPVQRETKGERTYTEDDRAQLFLGKNMGHLLQTEKEREEKRDKDRNE